MDFYKLHIAVYVWFAPDSATFHFFSLSTVVDLEPGGKARPFTSYKKAEPAIEEFRFGRLLRETARALPVPSHGYPFSSLKWL